MNEAAIPLLGAMVGVLAALAAGLGGWAWRERRAAATLRAQLVAAQAAVAAPAQTAADADGLRLLTPVVWQTCLCCRGPLPVVLCPHCHAPYHQAQISPRGTILNCWAAVVASGHCWHCNGDLTMFQPTVAPPPVRAATPALPLSLVAGRDAAGVVSPELPPRAAAAVDDFQVVA